MYSPLTMQELYVTVTSILKKYDAGLNFDWGTFCNAAYRGLISIMTKTAPYKQWAYLTDRDDVQTAGVYELLPEYIKMLRVMVETDIVTGGNPLVEARRVSVREYFSITSDEYNLWNMGLAREPVYALWGNRDNTYQQHLVMRIFPNPGTKRIRYTYYAAPARTTSRDDVIGVVAEYESIYITEVTIRMMTIYGMVSKAQMLEQELRQQVQTLFQANREFKINTIATNTMAIQPPEGGVYNTDNWYQRNLIQKYYGI